MSSYLNAHYLSCRLKKESSLNVTKACAYLAPKEDAEGHVKASVGELSPRPISWFTFLLFWGRDSIININYACSLITS